MALSKLMVVSCMVLAFLFLAQLAPSAEGVVSCGQVAGSIAKCLGYLQSKTPDSTGCCAGVRSLNAAAQTTADRKITCNCLKSIAGKTSGVNWGLAGSLPAKCGISLPYKISPTTESQSKLFPSIKCPMPINWNTNRRRRVVVILIRLCYIAALVTAARAQN